VGKGAGEAEERKEEALKNSLFVNQMYILETAVLTIYVALFTVFSTKLYFSSTSTPCVKKPFLIYDEISLLLLCY